MTSNPDPAAEETIRGNGDEPHQLPVGKHPRMTTLMGIPISDNQNTLKQGTRGPALLEDFVFREKIFHFDHERIPERIVHARGSGAHGYFELSKSLGEYTRAKILSEVGKKTPVFVRFSTVAGERGSVDTPRDVRGFAVKFYTSEGNWDLVGNDIPVFFVQDAIKFPDLIHATKPEPDRAFPQAATAHDTFWDFASLMPEVMHTLIWVMSDRGLPRSFRTMEGFGVHTFRLVNQDGRSTFVKFHWRPKLGLQSTLWDETLKLQHADNDYHRRDLWNSIESKNFPEWDLGVQLFSEEDASKFPFDHLDATKIIPEELVPLTIIGRMVLDRNPDNFFSETEQVAFCPANVPPGIDFTNDPLLQGRLFSYLDTQLSRLGSTNFNQLPINAPKCPFINMMRDGHMQFKTFAKKRVAYDPSSLESDSARACPETGFKSFAAPADDGVRGRTRPETFADHYSQPRLYYKSLTPLEQAHTIDAYIFELSKVETPAIQLRMLSLLRNIDEDMARRIATGLGVDELPLPAPAKAPVLDLPPSAALTIMGNAKNLLLGRCVGMLVDNGTPHAVVSQFKAAVEGAGACFKTIGSRLIVKLDDGKHLTADGNLMGSPSVLFDAVVSALTEDAALKLAKEAPAVDWFRDAFGHLKAIAACPHTQKHLFPEARIAPDAGIMGVNNPTDFLKAAATRQWDREPKVRNLP